MADAKSIPSELLDQLRRLSRPACLIDVPAALAVWANEGARRALELPGLGAESAGRNQRSWRLDASSPALDQLAALHQASASVDAAGWSNMNEMLAFRTATGVKRFSCRCRMLNAIRPGLVLITAATQSSAGDQPLALGDGDAGDSARPGQIDKPAGRSTGQSLWLEQARARHDAPPPRQSTNLAEAAGAAAREAGARGIGSRRNSGTLQDMATLQEIARRIREDRPEHQTENRLEDRPDQRPEHRSDFAAAQSRLHAANGGGDNSSIDGTAITAPAAAAAANKRPMIVIATEGDEMIASAPRHPPDAALNGAPGASGKAETATSTAGPLAQLAHELRTPISAIHTAAAIMAQERFGPIQNLRYKTYAQDIEQSAAHALEVITGMLHPESLRTGRPHLEFTQIDLDALVKDTLAAMAPLAEKASVELSGKLAQALPHVIADARAVKQMLLNLLTNALKFTDPGGRITVTTSFQLDGPVRIEVRDSGPGMSQQQIADVLNGPGADAELLQRRKNFKRRGKRLGLGLGLPLTLSLARANNAELRLISRGHQGGDDAGLSATIVFPKDRTLPAW